MRYQDQNYSSMSHAQLEELEADIHDSEYSGGEENRIDIDEWWRCHDHCYKPDTYYRGYRKRRLLQLVDTASLEGKSVLDVGCGRGELSVFMALHGAKVSGFDLSKLGIESAARLAATNGVADRCNFSCQSASKMSFDDESFDVVVYNAVLHHALKYPNIREETFRVLKPGGICVFAEGIRGNPLYRSARSVKRAITREQVKGDVDIDLEDMRRFSQGFTDVHIEVFCLTLGVKQLIGKPYGNGPLRRAVFYVLSKIDRAALAIFPSLKRYCSELVGSMRRPPQHG